MGKRQKQYPKGALVRLTTDEHIRLTALAKKADLSGLFVFDEAGSIPIRGLTNMFSLAPFSEVAIVVAFRHIDQIYNHYGPHGGDAVLRSFKTKVFLPSLDRRTTEFAARLAGFKAIQHEAIDERGKKSKGERLAGAKRVCIYAEELRQLDRHKRVIAVVGDAPPAG